MTGIFRGTGTSVAGIPQPDVLTRVAIAGDTMTGPLNVPAGATGTQVPQRQEIDTALALKANLISPVLVTPDLGTPSAGVLTNCTGTASGLTAGTVTTNANLTGEVTSVGNATTVTNSAVIGKVLTGFVSGAGTVAATDTILQASNKFDGNIAARALLAGASTQVFSAAAATAAAHVTRADQIQDQSVTAFTTAGTSTAYTLTPTPAITAYAIGQEFDVIFNAACGATPTIAISGLAAVNLVDRLVDGTYYNIPSGRIPINWRSKCVMISLTQMLVRDTPCETVTSTVLVASGVALTTNTAADVTSISIPAGDWEIFGKIAFLPTATTVKIAELGSVSSTSATLGAENTYAQLYFGSTGLTGGAVGDHIPLTNILLHLSVTTTYYLIAYSTFTTSTMKGAGTITARRYK